MNYLIVIVSRYETESILEVGLAVSAIMNLQVKYLAKALIS